MSDNQESNPLNPIDRHFYAQIKKLVDNKGMNAIATVTGIPVKTLTHWYNESSVPSFDNLVKLIVGTGHPIEWFVGLGLSNYGYVSIANDETFDAALGDLITNAKSEIWMQGRAGRLLVRLRPSSILTSLVERLKKDLKLTLLLADPDKDDIVDLIVDGRGSNKATNVGVKGSIAELVQRFSNFDNSTTIYVPYICSSYVFFSDPQPDAGTVLALDANFQGESITNAPMVYTTYTQNPAIYEYYYQDFMRLATWDKARERE